MDIASLKKEAKSKKTAASRLAELARHSDTSVQLAVANNPAGLSSTLEYLGGHGKFNILKAVAKNPNTPDSVLEKLARYRQASVRITLAKRYPLTDKLIEQLCNDPDPDVRSTILFHYNIQIQQLEQFLLDSSPIVRGALAKRGFGGRLFALELWDDPDGYVRASALSSGGKRLYDLHLTKILNDEPIVRASLAQSWGFALPRQAIEFLAQDASREVCLGLVKCAMVSEIALAITSKDTDEEVCWLSALAAYRNLIYFADSNKKALEEILAYLSNDPSLSLFEFQRSKQTISQFSKWVLESFHDYIQRLIEKQS
jgi:hypothetical protein